MHLADQRRLAACIRERRAFDRGMIASGNSPGFIAPDAGCRMRLGLGQTPPTVPVPPAAPARPANFADGVMWGGIVGGVIVMIVGSAVGQNRLWTRDMKSGGHRRSR